MTEKNPENLAYQPPPPYSPQQQSQPYHIPQGTTQVVTVITNAAYGPEPVVIICPSCHQQNQTKLDYESSTKTHLMAFVICLLCWPCFWMPYAIDSCKDTNHYCSSCGAYLGTYRG
ncbi:hypothetical protein PVAND_006438 [Polypedilum vanderplanki]|uniref:LITAF domain-containing protein n=1 Tax=Polypedilum vanderplanki TaxID=319348 RepID=A0A9J6C3M8_POLVA|nr:hypothetical protein PVAND_006438 [Polypedilum vanderplanki]